MAEEEEPIEEPEEGEPEEGEAPTGEPAVEPRKEQRRETTRKPHEESTGESIYEAESGPNKILREILEKNPDVKQAHVEEVMDWASYSDQLTPGDVVQILTSMRGISANLAQTIGRKYLLALSKEMGVEASPLVFGGIPQQRVGFNMPWPAQPIQQPLAYGLYQPPFQAPGQYPPYQGRPTNINARPGLSREDVVEIIKARDKDRELEETKKELEVLKKGGGPSKGKVPTVEDFRRIMDERDKRAKEESEKNALMETLNLVRREMDNLNNRISIIEKDEISKKYGKET